MCCRRDRRIQAGFTPLTGEGRGIDCGVSWGSHRFLPWWLAPRSSQSRRAQNPTAAEQAASGPTKNAVKKKKTGRWRGWLLVFLTIAIILGVGRALMPWAVRDYVNRTLDRNKLYSGKIGLVQIHLWRGAYSIQDVHISKTTGNVPVPLFTAKQVDFAVQWRNLAHGKIVGRVLIDEPELNFVDAPSAGESQTGAA